MVCHHYANPCFLCRPHCLCRGDPVVTGQDHAHPVPGRVQGHTGIHAVAVPDPVREHHISLCPAGLQSPHQDVGGADPVDIIISDHTHRSPVPDPGTQDPDSLFHIRKKAGIMQVCEISFKKTPGLFDPYDVPVPDQARQYLGDPAFLRDRPEIRLLCINHPFSHKLSPR